MNKPVIIRTKYRFFKPLGPYLPAPPNTPGGTPDAAPDIVSCIERALSAAMLRYCEDPFGREAKSNMNAVGNLTNALRDARVVQAAIETRKQQDLRQEFPRAAVQRKPWVV